MAIDGHLILCLWNDEKIRLPYGWDYLLKGSDYRDEREKPTPISNSHEITYDQFGDIADWRVMNIANKMISDEMEFLPQFKLAFLKNKLDGYNE